MPNRLANETSPYLLQHKDNPVDWYPWGQEALASARDQDKPIFLSIGYAACHWCHVMEHESFENEEIAAILNEHFVPIKVDREERPDLDSIYMTAVQMLTGHGGWPMSVFLTPELKPFFGGTYWPPEPARGMPGFGQVLKAVQEAWRERREAAQDQAGRLTEQLQLVASGAAGGDQAAGAALGEETLRSAAVKLERMFDFTHGGFGGAPKFPHAMDLSLLLRVAHRFYGPEDTDNGPLRMVELNLEKMARGGIYDHLGGGFHRYSVDAQWLAPHFEKMLYDNALLAGVYLQAHQATGRPLYAQVVEETSNYVLRDMTDPAGGFYSTEDADSEGEEGKFYVWTPSEIAAVLGPAAADRFCRVYDVTEQGNFEGRSILNLPKTIEQAAALLGSEPESLRAELAESRKKLWEAREKRIRPGLDDKVLVSWNALMIDSLARAAGVLGEPGYLAAAQRAAGFIKTEMRRDDGRLLHSWRQGQARHAAYLDDYGYLINALVSLYEADFDESWIAWAVQLAETVLEHFADEAAGGFFFTADDHEQLIARTKDLNDSSVPSASGMAATALFRLSALTGEQRYGDAARQTAESAAGLLSQSPAAAGQLLIALDMQLGPFYEMALVGEEDALDTAEVLGVLRRQFAPNRVVALRPPEAPADSAAPLNALFRGKTAGETSPTLYVCRQFACQEPVSGRQAVLDRLRVQAAPERG